MIPVQKKPEPSNFNSLVRQPGKEFLLRNSTPRKKDWDLNRYWKKALPDLFIAYNSICAYCGEWIPKPGSVDHFIPKFRDPNLAYEWDNYRFCMPKLNNYKGDLEGIADPFKIKYGWFILDIPSCLIKPGSGLTSSEMQIVQFTIDSLKLNDDDDLVQNRCNILLYYVQGDVSYKYLQDRHPFIAAELERQGIIETVKKMFRSL